MCRHTEKERAASAEQSRLQTDLEQLRTEAAATARKVQELEGRAANGDAAVAEAQSLREEAAAACVAKAETDRKLKESESALQQARDELEMMHDKVSTNIFPYWGATSACSATLHSSTV